MSRVAAIRGTTHSVLVTSYHGTSLVRVWRKQAMIVKLHALKRVGAFAGETDVERWIDRIELAMRIDGVPESKHADVHSLHLETYDSWKGLAADKKQDAAAIKAELRMVFGLQRMEAWSLASSSRDIGPGETVDVLFEELKKLVGIATEGGDAVGRIAACLFIGRLPSDVRERIPLQCGKDMTPVVVVECAKQLMAIVSPPTPAFSATVDRPVSQDATASRRSRRNAGKQRAECRCFNCHQLGHLAREMTCSSRQ